MIVNYFLIALRNLRAQKVVSFINIFGLSVAIGICITVFLFLKNYWNLDIFHTNGGRIFMVEYQTNMNNIPQTWGNTPAPLATALSNDFPQVERAVRVFRESVEVLHKNERLGDVLTYADTGFFDMFTFPLKYGNPLALRDPNALILSSSRAQKYFGNENPTGRQLTLINSNREYMTFTVQGVAESFPNNTGFAFDLLVGWHSGQTALKNQGWKDRSDGIFVQLRNAGDAENLAGQLAPYVAQFNAANPDLTVTNFKLDNLKYPDGGAYDVIQRPAEAAHPAVTVMYALIALLMLALSCFNYVNIALGSSLRRLREIGVRKVIGGSRRQIMLQFMAEHLLLVFFALLVGLVITQLVFIPIQNELMVIQTDSFLNDIRGIWPFLVSLLVVVGLLSGAYPALYVSRFNATAIFTGKQKFGEKSALRRAMLGGQFTLAYLAVIISVVLFVSGGEFRNMPWGYDADRTLVVQLSDSAQYSLLRNEMLKNAEVEAVAGATHHIGFGSNPQTISIDGRTQEISRYDVGTDYDRAMGLPLRSGRFFQPGEGDHNSIVVSEYFAEKQGWDDPIGKTIRLEQQDYAVVGVMADVKTVPTNALRPVVFFKGKEAWHNFLLARFAPGTGKTLAEKTMRDYQRLFAGLPARYFFQNEIFDDFDRSYRDLSMSFGYVALLALLLACMGLYGLVAQHYARRLKEVSVRKLLGASVGQIALLVNWHFGVILLIAGGIASTVCWLAAALVLKVLSQYIGTYRPSVWPFLLANLLVFATAAATVVRQTWKISRVKLAETLKNAD